MKNTDKPIIVEEVLDASIETVWSAITELGQMKQWYFENLPSFKPEVGFETVFEVQVEERIFTHCWKITEATPPHRITYNWKYKGYPGDSFVTFELIKLSSHNTKLRLTDSVIESFPTDIPEFKRESGVEGWNYFIGKSLKEYLKNQLLCFQKSP